MIYLERVLLWYSHDFVAYGVLYGLRFYGAKFAPLLIFTGYLVATMWPRTKLCFTTLSYVGFAGALGAFSLFAWASLNSIPLSTFFGIFRWSYTAIIEYLAAFILFILLGLWKTRDALYAVTLASVAISAASMIYELPIYPQIQHTDIYFHETHALFIATPILSLILFLFLLYEQKAMQACMRDRALFVMAFTGYLIWSVIYFFNNYLAPTWLPRLPTLLLCAASINLIKLVRTT